VGKKIILSEGGCKTGQNKINNLGGGGKVDPNDLDNYRGGYKSGQNNMTIVGKLSDAEPPSLI